MHCPAEQRPRRRACRSGKRGRGSTAASSSACIVSRTSWRHPGAAASRLGCEAADADDVSPSLRNAKRTSMTVHPPARDPTGLAGQYAGLRRRQGLQANEARAHHGSALHGRAADEAPGPARCQARQGRTHDPQQCKRCPPAGSGQSAIQGRAAQPAVGVGRYNRARLHSTLAYVSPMQFEQNWLATQPKQANS